jgi:hypothetical protein
MGDGVGFGHSSFVVAFGAAVAWAFGAPVAFVLAVGALTQPRSEPFAGRLLVLCVPLAAFVFSVGGSVR